MTDDPGAAEKALRDQLLDKLISQRRALRIGQRRMAQGLDTTQSVVSVLERRISDPRLSVLQAYAREVGLYLHVDLFVITPAPEHSVLASLRRPVAFGLPGNPAEEEKIIRARLLERLVLQREAFGISQRQLAQILNTSQSVISQLERGFSDPRLSVLQAYARAVGLYLYTDLSCISPAR